MIEITHVKNPPHQLVLGAWGVDAVDKRLGAIRSKFDTWRERGGGDGLRRGRQGRVGRDAASR